MLSVGLDILFACDRSPNPHLVSEELTQLFGPAQHERNLLGFGELPGDAVLAHTGRDLGAETRADHLGRARGREQPPPGIGREAGKAALGPVGTAPSAGVRALPVCTTARMVPT